MVTGISQDNISRIVAEFRAKAVDLHEIYGVGCDIFAPCALGAIINDDTFLQLTCRVSPVLPITN